MPTDRLDEERNIRVLTPLSYAYAREMSCPFIHHTCDRYCYLGQATDPRTPSLCCAMLEGNAEEC
jgi:hypothetical protein